MQKILILVGILLVVVGILWPYLSKLPLGKLPGDIVVEKDKFTLYIPIVTSILLSLLLTLILNLFFRRF